METAAGSYVTRADLENSRQDIDQQLADLRDNIMGKVGFNLGQICHVIKTLSRLY